MLVISPRLPRALSCSGTLPFTDTCSAFFPSGRALCQLTLLVSRFGLGRSLQAGQREPVQLRSLRPSGNYHLSPTRRTSKTPPAAAIGNLTYTRDIERSLVWVPNCGYTERTVLVSAVSYTSYSLSSSTDLILDQTASLCGFFSFTVQETQQKKRISAKILNDRRLLSGAPSILMEKHPPLMPQRTCTSCTVHPLLPLRFLMRTVASLCATKNAIARG